MNDELEKAYEADKERKSVKSDELQAARDYVGVLLDEAEGRNAQLEDKKQEADELLERLYKKEEEMDALIKVAESEKKKNRLATFWMCFALAELLMIVVFAIVLIVNSGSLYRNPNTVLNRESNTDKGQSPDTDIVQEETPSTVKYSDDLAERVRALKAQDMYPFRASVEKVDGLEYLVFTSGNISVGYKNEYNPEESKYRKCMIVDNGLERYVSERSYDLKGDLMNLVPTFTTINDRRMLAFIEYNSRVAVNIPSAVNIINGLSLRTYIVIVFGYLTLYSS